MDPNEDNKNHPLTHGDSSRTGGQTILVTPSICTYLAEMIERTVREEIQLREEFGKAFPYINLPPKLLRPNQNIRGRYRLQFINKVIKDPTFTTNKVIDVNGNPIRVEIYDLYTQSVISPDCFLSNAKVTITVLDAELWKNKGVKWSRSEFVQNVLREREGKRSILTGRLSIRLDNGFGTFGNIVFTDNSSWTKSGFRLGVMVEVDEEEDGENGSLNGEIVQEGVSKPFRVKDRCMKASQKPDRLNLTDTVPFIKRIGKDRASLLQKKDIKTVENFLWWYYNNRSELREILCIKSESSKAWESIVEHVTQCADEYHVKCNIASNNSSQPRQVLVDPMERTMSLSTNGGHCVVGSGSSEPNPSENNIIEAGIPIWPSMNLSNDPISTAYGDLIVERENPLFHEIGDSVQHTNVGGFPQSELPFDPFYDPCITMDDLFADVEEYPIEASKPEETESAVRLAGSSSHGEQGQKRKSNYGQKGKQEKKHKGQDRGKEKASQNNFKKPNKAKIECFNCGKKGHYARGCKEPRKTQGQHTM